jgi:hypothetical protein
MLIGRHCVAVLTLLGLALAAGPLSRASAAEGRRNWQLDVSNTKLSQISVPLASGERRMHWFFLFRVENHTGADRPLNILVKGEDDEMQRINEGIYPDAEAAVEKKIGGTRLSLAERPTTIKDGEGLDFVAMLGPVHPEADLVSIYITGLTEPVVREKGKEYHERKALRVDFKRVGDEYMVSFDHIEPGQLQWVELAPRAALPNAARAKRE